MQVLVRSEARERAREREREPELEGREASRVSRRNNNDCECLHSYLHAVQRRWHCRHGPSGCEALDSRDDVLERRVNERSGSVQFSGRSVLAAASETTVHLN